MYGSRWRLSQAGVPGLLVMSTLCNVYLLLMIDKAIDAKKNIMQH